MDEKQRRLEALKEESQDFKEAVEALLNSNDPRDRIEGEKTLMRAGWTRGADGQLKPPRSPRD